MSEIDDKDGSDEKDEKVENEEIGENKYDGDGNGEHEVGTLYLHTWSGK